jgi:peptidoglycan/LPS O-acetylase OafA/YrhL
MLGLPLVLIAGVNASVDKRLLFLERLSYPLYLVHWPVILAIHHALQGRMGTPAIAAVLVGSSCAAAWIVLIAYDEPARRWLTRRFDRRQSARFEPQPANLTAS